MPLQSTITAKRLLLTAVAALCVVWAVPADAGKKKPRYLGAPVFDIDKRKKTKSALTDWASYGAYASVRYSGERNLRLDDDQADKSDKFSAYVGVAARVEPTVQVVGFTHLEAELTKRNTHSTDYTIKKIHIKEAVASLRLSDTSVISAGRMRFSDARKWMTDASVDGVHYGFKGEDLTLDIAAFEGTRKNNGRYALAHASNFYETSMLGGFAILESREGEERAHISGYWSDKVSDTLSYTLNAGVVLGDAANGQDYGFAADARVIKQLGDHEWKPQLTLGLAAGSKGFQQTDLHTNKTYDYGQTQFNRYGYVYQPQLTNMAVATVGIGLRPSRMFSLDITAHAYAQVEPMTGEPAARVSGETTGKSAFLGGELSLVGAWRPTKKSKFELGLSAFKPGAAYKNRGVAAQAYARFSVYF
ncbi:MAG: alginate export family protein [Pseudomonadota bacterium]